LQQPPERTTAATAVDLEVQPQERQILELCHKYHRSHRYWSCKRRILEPDSHRSCERQPLQLISKDNHRSIRYWSCEQQIPLEHQTRDLQATATGSANDSHGSLNQQPLEPRTTASSGGALNDSLWRSLERQPLEPQTTASGATNNSHWRRERHLLEQPITTGSSTGPTDRTSAASIVDIPGGDIL